MDETQDLIIQIIGWVYFAAWSLSFYGQIYVNFRQRSVEGMNFDFVAMNLTGFTFYSLYCSYGYFVDSQQTGRVDLNDCVFAYHALFATLVTVAQTFVFPRGKNRLHLITLLYILALWAFLITVTILTRVTNAISKDYIQIIAIMGYFKLSISFFKYLPQLYWNYQRKSTQGWSIFNIILDLTGGTLSFAQMLLQSLFGDNVQYNVIKIALGCMVIVYDILFIIQHYCLYPPKNYLSLQDQPIITKDTNVRSTILSKN